MVNDPKNGEVASIVGAEEVQAGDMVFIPSVAIVMRGQTMLQLPHVDGVPDRIMALHPEWFGHATRQITYPAPLPERELIRDCLAPYVAADKLETAVEVMWRTLEKHVQDEPIITQAVAANA